MDVTPGTEKSKRGGARRGLPAGAPAPAAPAKGSTKPPRQASTCSAAPAARATAASAGTSSTTPWGKPGAEA
jgi:hypothetical protein